MIEAARKKNVYTNLICDFMSDQKLDINAGIFIVTNRNSLTITVFIIDLIGNSVNTMKHVYNSLRIFKSSTECDFKDKRDVSQ